MNQNSSTPKKSFWSERGQIAAASYALWGLLAMWSIAAFWSHIDKLGSDYVFMAKVGAVASEVVLFCFVSWHVFQTKMRVRLWALIFSFVLGAAILFHAGALQSMNSAKAEQDEKNAGLVENLAKLNKESVVSVNPSRRATQRERINIAGKEAQAQADAIKNAQGLLVESANKSDEVVKDSTMLSHSYLQRHMYTALFVLSLTLFSVLMAIWMFAPGKTDADYDGIPDEEQQPQFQQQSTQRPAMIQPATTGARGGDMPDGLHWTEFERELNRRHPNTRRGARTEIDGTLFESNGRTWEAQGVYGAGQTSSVEQQKIQRPSFARRIFGGQADTPVQTASTSTDSKSADWPTDDGKVKRSH